MADQNNLRASSAAAERDAVHICKLLDLPDSARPKVAKYIRCNGGRHILQAAVETRKTAKAMKDAISDPWAYCIKVDNERWRRNQELYLYLSLYEQSLRSRIDVLMSAHLNKGKWWDPLHEYVDPEWAGYMLVHNPNLAARKPTAAEPVPPLRGFKRVDAFMEAVHLADLHHIVVVNWGTVFKGAFLDPKTGAPFEDTWLSSAFESIEQTRNDVMHCRFVPREAQSGKLDWMIRLLGAMEWDVPKAIREIIGKEPAA